MNCSYREGAHPIYAREVLTELRDNDIDGKAEFWNSVLDFTTARLAVGLYLFPFFFFAKFLNKVSEKDYFLFMKGSECFFAVEIIKLAIAMKCS